LLNPGTVTPAIFAVPAANFADPSKCFLNKVESGFMALLSLRANQPESVLAVAVAVAVVFAVAVVVDS
jgi:hypothetical protein